MAFFSEQFAVNDRKGPSLVPFGDLSPKVTERALGVPSLNGYFELYYVAVRTCVLYHAESLEFGETSFDMQFQIKYHK